MSTQDEWEVSTSNYCPICGAALEYHVEMQAWRWTGRHPGTTVEFGGGISYLQGAGSRYFWLGNLAANCPLDPNKKGASPAAPVLVRLSTPFAAYFVSR